MSGRPPVSFCRSVEQVSGLVTVIGEWRRLLADDWPWARALLRPSDRIARYLPAGAAGGEGEPATGYRVFWHDEAADRYLGYRDEDGGRVELCGADLIIYALDRRALASRITAALSLVSDYGEVEDVPHTAQVGLVSPLTGDEISVYMTLHGGSREVSQATERLSVRDPRPFLLLTPTRSGWRPLPASVRERVRVVAMDEQFLVAEDGRWLSAMDCSADTSRARGHAMVNKPALARSVVGKGLHQIGKYELLVLRVLAASPSAMVQEDVVAGTKAVGHRLSRKTVGRLLNKLAADELVEYVPRSRAGARITDAGRSWVEAAASASH